MNYYSETISKFVSSNADTVLGQIFKSDDHRNIDRNQRDAWLSEIEILQQELVSLEGRIIFEYSIPRLGKRVDCIVLSGNCIFVLEFKTFNGDASTSAINQAWDYALGLKFFHETSQHSIIVPMLVTKRSSCYKSSFDKGEQVYSPIVITPAEIYTTIQSILSTHSSDVVDYDWIDNWQYGRYNPSPTIIEAAINLYNTHGVADIQNCKADEIERLKTTDYILDVIKTSKENHQKSICFVTGVPGAGKTLVGLDIAVNQQEDRAVFLSGNGPLVEVLRTALSNDRYERKHALDRSYTKKRAEAEVNPFIQLIHHYRKNALQKISDIKDGKIIVSDHLGDTPDEVEHVAIFDEAQRAWDKNKLCRPDRFNRKSEWLNEDTFPYSEPGFLIWSMDLKPDWAVIVCLVGGGQEINTGEAGILEWVESIEKHFPHWHVYISNELYGKEYAGEHLVEILPRISNVTRSSCLHLSVSKRSFRAENISSFVHHLLNGDVSKAKELYESIKHYYPLYLTRDLNVAKQWLRKQRKALQRSGLLISSQAGRLRALGLEIKKVTTYDKVSDWFLGDSTNVESSDFLEVALGEFFVQGLELDWTAVIWDADFRYNGAGWDIYNFSGGGWHKTMNERNRNYQLNGYRVLLTRARLGMVIVVPVGNTGDATRNPEYYDCTYEYLYQIGLQSIDL